LRAGAFFDARLLVARDLLVDARFLAGARFFVVRLAGVLRFFAVLVVLDERLRGAVLARAVRFFAAFFVVFLRGVALARAGRFFAVDLRGPVFRAVVARFFVGAFRGRAFFAGALRARDFRAGGRRRVGGRENVEGGNDS
jgi:hypothetical protein